MTQGLALTATQRDALRELANVGAGHAATALSRLLSGERLAFAPPEVWTQSAVPWRERLHGYAPWVAAVVPVLGDVQGALWFLFGQKDLEAFAGRLSAGPLEPSLLAAAHEAGAMALSAMGRLTGLTLEGFEPGLQRSQAPDAPAAPPAPQPAVLVVGVRLQARGFSAQFLFLPGQASVGTLLHSLRV